MAQADIIDYLKSQNGRLCSWNHICNVIDINPQNISKNLRKLVMREEIIAVYVYSNNTKRMVWKYGYKQ